MRKKEMIQRFVETVQENGIKAGTEFVINSLRWKFITEYNEVKSSAKYYPPTDTSYYREVQEKAKTPTDISGHLESLYLKSLEKNPETIVEIGVRGGESTFVFERVADICNAHLISIDIADCSDVSDYNKWHFVQADATEFANEFDSWAQKKGISHSIDVLFVDTTHRYEETMTEIQSWFPKLSDDAVIFFHDTNLKEYYKRKDGTIGIAWDNKRGVIRAIEDYFDAEFDESRCFCTIQSRHIIEHDPYCNGMTVIHRLPIESPT